MKPLITKINRMENKIFNSKYEDIINQISDKSIDLVLTDPPYLHLKSATNKQYQTKSKFASSKLYNYDEEMLSDLSSFGEKEINSLLNECKRVCKKMNCYFFCSEDQIRLYANWASSNDYHFSLMVWEKPLSIISKNRYSQNIEFIVRVYEFGTGLNTNINNEFYNKVKKYKPLSGKNKIHPTEKPIELINELILLNSKENDIVLDMFAGSGVVGESCSLLNRYYILIEKKEEHFIKLEKRIKQVTSNKQNKNKFFK